MNEVEFYREVDWLPHPIYYSAQEIIDELEFRWEPPKGDMPYKTYYLDPDIHDYYQTFFDEQIMSSYQLITGPLPPHKDYNILKTKFVYNHETGGDVITRWHTEDGSEIVKEVRLEANKWYELRIDKMHSITAPQGIRYAMVLRKVSNDLRRNTQ